MNDPSDNKMFNFLSNSSLYFSFSREKKTFHCDVITEIYATLCGVSKVWLMALS